MAFIQSRRWASKRLLHDPCYETCIARRLKQCNEKIVVNCRLIAGGLGGEFGAALAHAAFVVLPEAFGGVEMAEGARDCLKVIARKALGDFGVIKRLLSDGLQNLIGELSGRPLVAGLGGGVRFALDVIGDLGAVGISVGDALVAFFGDAFADGCVDAD